MHKMFIFLQIFVGSSFLIFGAGCFFSKKAKSEFVRYQLPQLRSFVGVVQIALGLMMLLGLNSQSLLLCSAVGLTLMMGVAIVVRLKIQDSLLMSLPAIFYFVASGALVVNVFL